MGPTRHQQLMELFDRSCDLPPVQQAALLEGLRGDDPELARALARLLHHDRAPPDALDAGAVRVPLPGPTAAPDALPSLPDLELVSVLAEGGMGRVLLARQRSLGREVAVKLVRPGDAAAHLADGLLAEGLLMGALDHPNIVPVHLLERDPQGQPVLVMKRVEGVSWAALIRQPEHPLWARLAVGGDPLAGHLQILTSVCNALHFAHSRGIIHRDVKPDNVMVGSFGEVYLLDWGIALRAAPELPPAPAPVVGTPGYMAPEMAAGRACDARTDVYLLGASLHQALTGQLRHQGRTLAELLAAAQRSQPVPYGPEVPEELAAICNRATAAEPAERFPSAAALRDALGDFARHRGAIALCDRAGARLQEARSLLAQARTSGDPGRSAHEAPDGIHGRMRALLLEIQFGFQESLRQWPDSPRARAGLRECRLVGAEQELLAANLPGARALLAQVEDPPAALLAQLAALRELQQAQRTRAARLDALERAHDWRVGAVPRRLVMLLAAGLSLALWRALLAGRDVASHPIPPGLLALAMAGMLAGCSLLMGIFRRRLLLTEVNRQIVLGFLCCLGGMTASRALHVIPTTVTGEILSMDQVVAATVAAVGGLVLARWLWLLTPVLLLGALAARFLPAHEDLSLLASGIVSTLIGVHFLSRPSPQKE